MIAAAIIAQLTVPRVDLGIAPEMGMIDAMFESGALTLHEIGCVNWPEDFPDKPRVHFRIAHSGDEIFIKYYVNEGAVRAVYDTDDQRPWEESCVEFFVAPDDPGEYYCNLEMSCIGYGILHEGVPGKRAVAPGGVEKVRRLPSISREPFGIREGEQFWTLTLAIPIESLPQIGGASLSGRTLRANFYKCGDKLPRPHYLSWSPIDTTEPSFHRPDFFGRLFFE